MLELQEQKRDLMKARHQCRCCSEEGRVCVLGGALLLSGVVRGGALLGRALLCA